MNSNPLISVILPVYNAAKYVAVAIESILQQTYVNFELIIIDDSSSDNSATIIQYYAATDKRIKLMWNKENCGVAACLNRAVIKALGQYLARMDADDRADPERLARQLAFLVANPQIGVVGSWYNVYDDSLQQLQYSERKPLQHDLINIYLHLWGNPIGHPTVMLRKQVLPPEPYLATMRNNAEDYELWLRLSQAGIKFANIPAVLLDYRLATSSLSKANQTTISDFHKNIITKSLTQLGIKGVDQRRYLNYFIYAAPWWYKLLTVYAQAKLLQRLWQANLTKHLYPRAEFKQFLAGYRLTTKIGKIFRGKSL